MITHPMDWSKVVYYPTDRPDIEMDTELTIMQMFFGDLNLNVEPMSQMLRLRRRLENGCTDLTLFFEVTDVDDGSKIAIVLPVHFLHQIIVTPWNLTTEMPVAFVIYFNEKGVSEIKNRLPNRWSAWEAHFEKVEKKFPEALMFIVDPMEMRTFEYGREFIIGKFFSLVNYFIKLYTPQWIKHLKEQCKMTEEEIVNHPMIAFTRSEFADFYEQLNLKHIESAFPGHAKKPARMFINVVKEIRITRRAKRKMAAAAAAATKLAKKRLLEEEEANEEREEEGESSTIHDNSGIPEESTNQSNSKSTSSKNQETSEKSIPAEIRNSNDVQQSSNGEKQVKIEDNIDESGNRTVEQILTPVECNKEIKQEVVDEMDASIISSNLLPSADQPAADETKNGETLQGEASESEAQPVTTPKKRRKKCKKIGAPARRRKVRKSPSYDQEEEEILLIESELKRQNGENSDSDVSEELGEPSESLFTTHRVATPAAPTTSAVTPTATPTTTSITTPTETSSTFPPTTLQS